jgi:hypothetical protein
VLSLAKKSYFLSGLFLPVLAALVSFILFQLALHDPINARAFSSLEIASILPPTEYNGVYTHLLARLFASVFNDPELGFRILTALATGFSVYFIQKLFPSKDRWSASYILANVSFLYFAFHSPNAMLIVLVFAAYLAGWESASRARLPIVALLASLMLGFDGLLATALILHTTVRIFASKENMKGKLVALASSCLGVAVWLLLAYMLYAAHGFMIAIGQSFDHLFTQVNPINFGVGLLATFNLLLVWIFRSPTERTGLPYLGSVLIVLFLFVQVEPIHLVLLLIIGVTYLLKTGSLPKQRWVLPVYAVLNIGAFILLPNVDPLEATYNVRTARLSDAEAYYNSYFAKHLPGYQALMSKARVLEASRGFVNQKSELPVVLDPSTEAYFEHASLRADGTRRMIAGFDVKKRSYLTVFDRDTSMIESAVGYASLNYLATDALPRPIDSLLQAIDAPMKRQGDARYYTIDSSHFGEFFDSYIYHHYISFH